MKRTVKRKLIAGAVVVGLISTTGVAFGATDAGAGLKGWYDSQFKKANTEVAIESAKHTTQKLLEFNNDTKELKTGATESINGTRDTETEAAKSSIHQESRDYINSVNSKKAEIQNNIDNQFKKIEDDANKAILAASKLTYSLAELDLKTQTSKEGKAALAFLNTEIEKETNKALSDLEWEIRTTKGFLQDLLNKKSSASIESINKTVDNEIARLLNLITKKTGELVTAQQTAISSKAAELEAAAKLKLEERVNALINEK
ncbi:hypothetical protein [Psychrobacillus psychrodurans]|uniref:hypothetical protein n=1 Tax=Psychrobacillus psychrodurans TaxID=126157 RepID=UPI003D0200EF